MCGNEKCKHINIFYLDDVDEKIFIHYDEKHNPIWIQHFKKDEQQTTFIPDRYELYDATHKYKPKVNTLYTNNSILYDF